jgi:hypothetical protein
MSMLRLAPLALAAALALVAVRPALAAKPPLTGAALTQACEEAKGEVYRLQLSPETIRQGATLRVGVTSLGRNNPWGASVPNACLTGWKVSEPKLARLSGDHTQLVIAATAPVGATFTLSARTGGKTTSAAFVVVAKDAVVLTGYWSEVGEPACPVGETPLRELHFTADGKFEATWTPFERYIDYWGDFAFNAATGALVMTPTGGNRRPVDADLSGRATLDPDGDLRLEGMFMGSPGSGAPTAAGCPLVFKHR